MGSKTGSSPRTAAGKALLDLWLAGRTHPPSTQRLRDFTELVCAIEVEAERQPEDAARGCGYWLGDHSGVWFGCVITDEEHLARGDTDDSCHILRLGVAGVE